MELELITLRGEKTPTTADSYIYERYPLLTPTSSPGHKASTLALGIRSREVMRQASREIRKRLQKLWCSLQAVTVDRGRAVQQLPHSADHPQVLRLLQKPGDAAPCLREIWQEEMKLRAPGLPSSRPDYVPHLYGRRELGIPGYGTSRETCSDHASRTMDKANCIPYST